MISEGNDSSIDVVSIGCSLDLTSEVAMDGAVLNKARKDSIFAAPRCKKALNLTFRKLRSSLHVMSN